VYPRLERHEASEKALIPNDFTMKDINGSAASIFIAGSNTTYTTTVIGILNLLLNPEVFAKARIFFLVPPHTMPKDGIRTKVAKIDFWGIITSSTAIVLLLIPYLV
jgi:hypothetical protein